MTALVLAVAFACAAGVVHAQNIFFDTFTGRELRPHWLQPPPGFSMLFLINDEGVPSEAVYVKVQP